MYEKGFNRNDFITAMGQSPHGDLSVYADMVASARRRDQEFLAHAIAWNEINGKVRDARIAFPVLSLETEAASKLLTLPGCLVGELVENSWAHILMQSPRDLARGYRFALSRPNFKRRGTFRDYICRYLRAREDEPNWWDRTVVQHRSSVKELYALAHVKPSAHAQRILFESNYPGGSVFAAIRDLSAMSAPDAASTIVKHRLPFLIIRGALGKKAKEPDLLMAMIQSMSPTELVTSAKTLEDMGMKLHPQTRAAFEEGLKKVATSKKQVLKTSVAAEKVSVETREKLAAVQEKQVKALGPEGDWLVFGDCSGSMHTAIEAARFVAGTLAGAIKGRVHLVFGNTEPRYFDATGKTLDEIKKETRLVSANGGTSIGCGLDYIMKKGHVVNGIVLVTDCGENSYPLFVPTYQAYCKRFGIEPGIYVVLLKGDAPALLEGLKVAGVAATISDMRTAGVDYHSLPNLVMTMRANRYSLLDDIMETKLVTVAEVLRPKRKAA